MPPYPTSPVSALLPASEQGPEPNAALDERAASRKQKRAAKAAERKARVEELKNLGNEAFKMKDWRLAHDLYMQAMTAAGEEGTTRKKGALVPWLNIIQVYMKTNMPDLAEKAATAALTIDPQNVKARFRRGIARRDLGLLQAAVRDFKIALALSPNLIEAQTELAAAQARLRRGEGVMSFNGESDDESPALDEHPISSDDESDSSDYNHTGNGEPCRNYNRRQCKRGNACPNSHAPDESAERDALGRNVCKGFLIHRCDAGSTCAFAHSAAYLEPALPRETSGIFGKARRLESRPVEHMAECVRSDWDDNERTPQQQVALHQLMRELDHGYTDEEFKYMCANGVNPYCDHPDDVAQCIAEYHREHEGV
ncbi:TPR-like protein [Auricularia subglabra TFB-10046 SS5]|nr:TPR-like protein [Auricularia subglabra TFB-10046 SS5]